MNERLKSIRKHFGLNQKEMGDKIKLSQTHISSLENGAREITDRIISDICREFNVNEEWLRIGEGEMLVQPKTFTLDEKAQHHNLTDLEISIMKNYMELDEGVRQKVMNMLRKTFGFEEIAATAEDEIEVELERYRSELEAEKKIQKLSASVERETS